MPGREARCVRKMIKNKKKKTFNLCNYGRWVPAQKRGCLEYHLLFVFLSIRDT